MPNIEIHSGSWDSLGASATMIRRTVFVEEQGVPIEEELDHLDADCLHFLVTQDGAPIATARLLADGHIGRVAVLKQARGTGLGYQLMKAAIQAAREKGHTQIEISAQTYALPFYERLGFKAHGDEYMDAGIPHFSMTLTF